MEEIKEFDKEHFFQIGHRRSDVTIVEGRGTIAIDEAGKEYLDFTSGYGALSLGHCHPIVTKALESQANRLIHTGDDVYTVPQFLLAKSLFSLLPEELRGRIFFQSTGTEAVELALKIAKKWGNIRKNGAYEVLYAYRSFHGRTLGSLSAIGRKSYRENFEPLLPGFRLCMFNEIDNFIHNTSDKTCAVIIELIQGEGGVFPAEKAFISKLWNWCQQENILLIFDEVQTGMCRTGTMFCFEQYNVVPDILIVGKGLGSGVPISAVICKEKANVISSGEHGSTFGGNPLMCHVAYNVLEYMIEEKLYERVLSNGTYLKDKLYNLTEIFSNILLDVRGRGLMLALQMNGMIAEEFVRKCAINGLLVNAVLPDALRFLPPLIVTKREIDKAIQIVKTVAMDFV